MTTLPPRQRQLLELCAECARRGELLAAMVRAGGVPDRRAARVLSGELSGVAVAAREAGLEALADMALAQAAVLAHLGGLDAGRRVCDVLVLDPDEVTRDLIALAVQGLGHRVRAAATLAELLERIREGKPELIITEAHIPNAPADQVCSFLRRAIGEGNIPMVLFASAEGSALATLALNAGADRFLSKDQGIEELTMHLGQLIEEIAW